MLSAVSSVIQDKADYESFKQTLEDLVTEAHAVCMAMCS